MQLTTWTLESSTYGQLCSELLLRLSYGVPLQETSDQRCSMKFKTLVRSLSLADSPFLTFLLIDDLLVDFGALAGLVSMRLGYSGRLLGKEFLLFLFCLFITLCLLFCASSRGHRSRIFWIFSLVRLWLVVLLESGTSVLIFPGELWLLVASLEVGCKLTSDGNCGWLMFKYHRLV